MGGTGLAPGKTVADFDSASGQLRALARALTGRYFPRLGQGRLPAAAVRAANLLPLPLRQQAYVLGGVLEAVDPSRLGEVDGHRVAGWIAGHYPRRRYPAVAIGSSNGAAVSLYTALGVPWLPQTFLLPVRHPRWPPDDAHRALEFGARAAGPLLAANPDLTLHHMHDPNQDRLMVAGMAYFRLKRLTLGRAYEQFLEECLEPGGAVLLLRHNLRWPATRVAERHVFQFGAAGGATAGEYHHGGPRVREFLRRHGSGRDRWDPPGPDGEAAEAEWGFAAPLAGDVRRWAASRGHPVREITLGEPEDLSPIVAGLFRRWYAARGMPAERLLVESFVMQDPAAALRSGSVPFWTLFPVEPSVRRLAGYLSAARPYAEIRALAFQHGVRSIGLAGLASWHAQLGRATRDGRFLALDESRYPADFAAMARYGAALRRQRPAYPLPERPLTIADADALLPGRWY